MTGLDKAALLLMTLGSDEASEILKHMNQRDVQKVGAAMASLRPHPKEDVELVISEVEKFAGKGMPVEMDREHIKSMLTKALGEETSALLLAQVMQDSDTAGIDGLKWVDAPTAADLIKNEHPQIISTILVHLDYDQAADILKHFTERLRNDVMLRIATFGGVQPVALRDLNDSLAKMLSGAASNSKSSMGGVRHAAEILNFIGSANETAVLDSVRDYDPDLAQKIIDEMFVFENLLDIDDRGFQALLREIQSDSLILALKGAPNELKEKVLRNMSQRAAETMREDMESRGPAKLSEVEAEQKEIIKVARRLAEEGQIVLGGKGGAEEMV